MLSSPGSRLGRGLGALIPQYDELMNDEAGVSIQNINLSLIVSNPYQPRVIFKEDTIKELADSIKEFGVSQPIIVRKVADKYELVAGERRYRACKLLELETIPSIVRDLSDEDSLQIALIENLQREDINPVEEARAYQQLINKFGYTQAGLAEKIGKSRPAVTNTIRLLDLPEQILEVLHQGQISAGHARALLALTVNEQKFELLKAIIEKGFSVRQTEEAVRQLQEAPRVVVKKKISSNFEYENKIKEVFWKKFFFKGNSKKGQLIFKYATVAEKEQLLAKLGVN